MNIEGVPDSLPASRVWAMIAELGIDISDAPWGEGITINGHGVEVTVYARNTEGSFYVDTATDEAAMHRISIPLVDDIHAVSLAK